MVISQRSQRRHDPPHGSDQVRWRQLMPEEFQVVE